MGGLVKRRDGDNGERACGSAEREQGRDHAGTNDGGDLRPNDSMQAVKI